MIFVEVGSCDKLVFQERDSLRVFVITNWWNRGWYRGFDSYKVQVIHTTASSSTKEAGNDLK